MGLKEELLNINELAVYNDEEKRYVYAQQSDEEDVYDFTIYDSEFKDIDGGQTECEGDLFAVIAEIVSEFFPNSKSYKWDIVNVNALLNSVLEKQHEKI